MIPKKNATKLFQPSVKESPKRFPKPIFEVAELLTFSLYSIKFNVL